MCIESHPNLMIEWDYEKNIISPYDVSENCHKKVWWVCKNKHSWEAVISSRANGHGCPYCTKVKTMEIDSICYTHKDLLREWDFSKNTIDPKTICAGSDKSVWWVCSKNHSWKTRVKHRTNGSGCPYCKGKKTGYGNSFGDNCPELLLEWHEKNTLSPYSMTPGSHKKVWWKCSKGHEWVASVGERTLRSRGCPYCSKRISRSANKWLDSLNIKERECYIKIDGKRFFVDGLDPKNNTVYEYFGNFWHGNPQKYNPKDIHPIIKKTFGELYKETMCKIKALEESGYKVVYKWGV
jgi:glutaredoxin